MKKLGKFIITLLILAVICAAGYMLYIHLFPKGISEGSAIEFSSRKPKIKVFDEESDQRPIAVAKIEKGTALLNKNAEYLAKAWSKTPEENAKALKEVDEHMAKTIEEYRNIQYELQDAKGFWGIDIKNLKGKANKYKDELNEVLSDIMLDLANTKALVNALNSPIFLNEAPEFKNNEEIKKHVKILKDEAKKMRQKIERTQIDELLKPLYEALEELADIMEKVVKAEEAKNQRALAQAVVNLDKVMKKIEANEKTAFTKLDELQAKSQETLDKYNKILQNMAKEFGKTTKEPKQDKDNKDNKENKDKETKTDKQAESDKKETDKIETQK